MRYPAEMGKKPPGSMQESASETFMWPPNFIHSNAYFLVADSRTGSRVFLLSACKKDDDYYNLRDEAMQRSCGRLCKSGPLSSQTMRAPAVRRAQHLHQF